MPNVYYFCEFLIIKRNLLLICLFWITELYARGSISPNIFGDYNFNWVNFECWVGHCIE